MWRRYGDAAYTLMTLAIFGFETIALGALSLSFLLGSASGIASTPVEGILLGIVISTASALALLGLYLLSYHFISNMRDRWQADQLDTWTEWWVGLALTGPDEPVGSSSDKRRLPRVAIHSVLSLLEAVKGEEGDRLKEALASHGVDSWFLRRARSGHLTAKLDAIENLGKARLPQAFDDLLGLFHHAKPVVRRMSARAAGVTLAVMPPEDGPDSPHARFIRAIKHADLQPGVVQESLLLLETRAGPILRELLADPDLSDTLRWVALETIGRLGLADMAEQAAVSSNHLDPELRAATFRCLRRLGSVPRRPRRRCWTPSVTTSTSSASRPPMRPLSSPPRLRSPRSSPVWRTPPGGSAGPRRRRWPVLGRSAWPPSGGPPRPIPTRPPVRWPCRSCWKRTC